MDCIPAKAIISGYILPYERLVNQNIRHASPASSAPKSRIVFPNRPLAPGKPCSNSAKATTIGFSDMMYRSHRSSCGSSPKPRLWCRNAAPDAKRPQYCTYQWSRIPTLWPRSTVLCTVSQRRENRERDNWDIHYNGNPSALLIG